MKKHKLKYKIKGERKKRQKQAKLPNKAKQIKCNKRPRTYGNKFGVKIRYTYKGDKREKIIPVPEGAKKITLK